MDLDSTDIFAERLRNLISDSGKTMRTISDEINISVGALSKYQNGKATAGIDIASKLAQYFNVSVDYLVGFIDTPYAPHADISKEIGLSAEAIDVLAHMQNDPALNHRELRVINFLIENVFRSNFMDKLYSYLFLVLFFPDFEDGLSFKLKEDATLYSSFPIVTISEDLTEGRLLLKSEQLNDIYYVEVQKALIDLKKLVDDSREALRNKEAETDGEH